MKKIAFYLLICVLVSKASAQGFGQNLTSEQRKTQDSLRQIINNKTNEDYQSMLKLLGIKSIRKGAEGFNTKAPNAANYDESKANPYPNFPDPLVLKNGEKVTSAAMWRKKRRAEIVEDFDREIYGRIPKNMPNVKWELISILKDTLEQIPVITKRLVGHVDNKFYPAVKVDIQLTLTTPANAKEKVPVMIEFNGFQQFTARQLSALPRPVNVVPNWQKQILDKGWGFALLSPQSIQADNGAGLTEGIIGLMNKGQRREIDDWGALRAWAWGASEALNYFETDKNVDAKKVGIEGHSRYGKAALVTLAYDDRFAIGFISSSGEGGAKLHRRNAGEIVENVASSGEYHWVAGNFIKYAGPLNWGDLPVDSHELIALCAPRPVFISVGSVGDNWVDARGMFMAAVAAEPVYQLLGKKGLGTNKFPAIQQTLIDGEIAYRQHEGGHTPGPNWATFIAFALKYFK